MGGGRDAAAGRALLVFESAARTAGSPNFFPGLASVISCFLLPIKRLELSAKPYENEGVMLSAEWGHGTGWSWSDGGNCDRQAGWGSRWNGGSGKPALETGNSMAAHRCRFIRGSRVWQLQRGSGPPTAAAVARAPALAALRGVALPSSRASGSSCRRENRRSRTWSSYRSRPQLRSMCRRG